MSRNAHGREGQYLVIIDTANDSQGKGLEGTAEPSSEAKLDEDKSKEDSPELKVIKQDVKKFDELMTTLEEKITKIVSLISIPPLMIE